MPTRLRLIPAISMLATAWLPLAVGTISVLAQDLPKPAAPDAKTAARTKEFTAKIRPILERYCIKCHGPEKPKGDLNLATFTEFELAKKHPRSGRACCERVQADEMPPKKAGEMPPIGRLSLIAWVRKLQPQELDCTKLASDRTVNFYLGSVMSRRLNRDEYANTVRDLLGLDVNAGRSLPADGAGGEGFDTTGDTLFTSPLTLEKYLESAEQAMLAVLPADGITRSPEQAAARAKLLGPLPDRQPHAARTPRLALLRRFLRPAFRRPVDDADVERYLAAFDHAIARGDAYEAAVRLALTGVLMSPHFLFLVEPEPAKGDIQPLGAFPLASRLSYFLWSTMPDEELLRSAESGELMDPDGYLAQVRRLVRDPRAAALGERFAVQWLEIDKLGSDVRPDAGRFPEFDDGLATAMRREVVAYFNHVVAANRPLDELLDSDYTFADARLAALYGVDGVRDDAVPTRDIPQPRSRRRDRHGGGPRGHVVPPSHQPSAPRALDSGGVARRESATAAARRTPLTVDERAASAANLREQLERHRAT